MRKILFVCSANKQRSKTAADYFSKKYPSVQFDSAGTNHKVCIKEGTQPLTHELMNWADVVITMEEKHKTIIIEIGDIKYQEKIQVVSIPDDFTYYQKELISILEQKVTPLITN
ncbi:phosphotyrosine protein phosphatase [uncultured Dokdonia sp.]|uniref:phosphotyrosine protein phosphatase n=1 Tax=uncultured Dokdonia sp. TaxID=575653 RepID=UPI00260428AF|nr:phosphotyrosine protein phosphatase [uncultured Dokdonia sp.]